MRIAEPVFDQNSQIQHLGVANGWAEGLTAVQEQATAVMELLRRETNEAVLDILRRRPRRNRG